MAAPPAHRVRARNMATASANRIHDDDVAREYGFAGGLVPGADVYAYLTHVPAATWGRAWLERGKMSARFERPVYDRRLVEVLVSPSPEGETSVAISLTLQDEGRATCAIGSAALPSEARPLPEPATYATPPLPEHRPPAEPGTLGVAGPLGSIETTFRASLATGYLDAIGDHLPLYRHDGLAHPGWLLRGANRLLARNFALGPWIHVASEARHGAVVADGDRISTRGRVTDVYERKGHGFVELDVLVVVNDDTPAMHVRHTAIYRPRRAVG